MSPTTFELLHRVLSDIKHCDIEYSDIEIVHDDFDKIIIFHESYRHVEISIYRDKTVLVDFYSDEMDDYGRFILQDAAEYSDVNPIVSFLEGF